MIAIHSARVVAFYQRTGLDPERVNELLVDMLEDVFGKKVATESEMLCAVRELSHAQATHSASLTSMMEAAKAQMLSDAAERGAQIHKVGEQFAELAVTLPRTQEEAARRLLEALDAQRQEPAVLAQVDLKLASHQQTLELREQVLNLTLMQQLQEARQRDPALLANLELKMVAHQQAMQTQFQSSREEQIGRRVMDDKLRGQLECFLQTMHSSQTRGQVSETQLETVLMEIFPCAEIVNTTGKTASGDFMLKREGKPDILVENKTYGRNVDRVEVDKFVRDVLLNGRCSGLFLSQRTGIVGKSDFEIDVQDGHVFVYAHCVDMNGGRIRAAVSIIDNLSARLAAIVETEGETGIAVPRGVLDEINEQYRAFEKRRSDMLAAVKENSKVMHAHVAAMEMPSLATYLAASYLTERTDKCTVCGQVCAGARGLAAHMRKHK